MNVGLGVISDSKQFRCSEIIINNKV